jgi:hypothetical protein
MKSIQTIITSFKKEYKDVPGIVEIQEGNSNGEPILVFINKSKLKSILPSSYQDISISYFDLVGIQNAAENMIKHITDNKFDLTDKQNQLTFNYLTKTNNLCKKLLQNELSSKT